MLHKTLVHLPGIGPAKEKRLWDDGISHWDDLSAAAPTLFRGSRLDAIRDALDLLIRSG